MKADFIKDKYKTTGVSLEMSVAEELTIISALQSKLEKEQNSLKFYTKETSYFDTDKEWLDKHNFNREEQIKRTQKSIEQIERMLSKLQS